MSFYQVGNQARLSVAFTVVATGAAIDPTTVYVEIRKKDGQTWELVNTYTYGVGIQVVRDGPGLYHLDLSLPTADRYRCRWFGTGAAEASDGVEIVVTEDQ